MTNIEDGEILFRYVSPYAFPEGQEEIPASIFNDPELSCDWKKLQLAPESSPHVAKGRTVLVSIMICDAIRNPSNPKRIGSKVPEWQQDIVHDPLEDRTGDVFTPNESHSLIKGKKKSAVTTAIRDNSTRSVISYSSPE